jgi:serine/threonine protein kinase
MSLRPGDPARVGQYRLTAKLGSGGMGVVYLGVAPDGGLVAVKVLRPEIADDPEFRRRFDREVTALMRVRGMCTVRVFEADTKSDQPFMVTEYVEGPSLADYIDKYGSLNADLLYDLATGLADALTVIHAAGIVHRDLKPSNVILAQDGPKVIDFGIAQTLDGTSVTQTGVMVGSPGFMAPEQITGHPGPAADIFVWGVTIAYAAVGHSPWGTGNTDAVLYRVMYADPDIAAVPDSLKPLVAAALAKDPQSRPVAHELLGRLNAMSARSAPISTRPRDILTQTVLARTWEQTDPHADPHTSRLLPAASQASLSQAQHQWWQASTPQRRQPLGSQLGPPAANGTLLLDPAPALTRPGERGVGRRKKIIAVATSAAVTVTVTAAAVLAAFVLHPGHAPAAGRLAGSAGQLSPIQTTALPGYAGQTQRGVFQTLSRIVSSGGTMVTTGSQTNQGGTVARQQFRVSADGGKTWHLAPVRLPDGGQPPLGYLAPLIAGGPHGWMAEGQNAIWTSPDGQSWTLAATHGIAPREPGDMIDVITSTADGFLAAGQEKTSDGGTEAVVWTSHDGLTWQRITASELRLASSGKVPQDISYATSQGDDTVISDGTSVWLSTNGGSAWTPVTVPVDHGARSQISGVSFDGSGLIAVRPGTSASGTSDGVAYFSRNGHTWQYTGTIDAAGGWSPVVVKGSTYGFVVTGTIQNQRVAYTSTGTGASWRPTGSLGSVSSESSLVPTVAPGGNVVAVGSTDGTAISQQAVLVEANTAGSVRSVPLASIPAITVNRTAIADGEQIAVGSADGYPAIWRKASDGSWALASSLSLVSGSTGLAQLTDVTHGSAGWLAVGFPGPVILTSANGISWKPVTGSMPRDLADVVSIAAAAGPAGYVIAGSELKSSGGCTADVYWSQNLASWTEAHDVNLATGSFVVLRVAAGPDGFVSVGSRDGMPVVWTTTDGRAWTTVKLPVAPDVTAGQMNEVAINGNRVVATGKETTKAGVMPLAELSTSGGTSWRQVPFGSPGPDTTITAITQTSGGFTAASQSGGSAADLDAAVWTSPTGASWTRSSVDGLTDGGSHEINALARSGSTVTGIDSVETNTSQEFVAVSLPGR